MAELIRDRYEPLEMVGAGGQSTVLRALDHQRDRLVALKVRPRGSADDEGSLLSEARILQGLEPHPLLCQVREDFFAGDRYVLVMDWIEGTTLADLLAAAAPAGLPLADVTHYLAQVAEALDHLHLHQPPVVHGDVKPANVIVTPDSKAVLVDFGISHRTTGGGTGDAPAAGTAGYAAPEVAMGQPPTPASDVFSLAATAFALLTGRPPRPGDRPAWSGIDDERARLVEFALRRGLAVDPARRPATARSLVDALEGRLHTPTNLSIPPTPFIGRSRELADVKVLLGTARLLTLTGANGLGKSRLAVQALADRLPDYPHGAYLVDVSGAAPDATALAPLVLLALGNRPEAPDPVQVLVARLERRNVVLVLDGCEAAPSAAADLATTLLDACPHVRLVATSRRPLGVPGEAVYDVPTLSAPDPFRLPALDELGDYDAVRLFADRAAAVRPGFDIRASDAPAVAQICLRCDAIPLALELVAGRLHDIPLGELAPELADRFPLVPTGRRSPEEREATLHAVIDWAYHALPEQERARFDRLAALPGPFGATGVETLVARGLVRTDGCRFAVHPALREFLSRKQG